MELNIHDEYQVVCNDNISEELLTSLVSLYQPLVGMDSIMLYLVLHSEGRSMTLKESHERLCALMNRSVVDIENARIHLEEYQLLRTFFRSDNEKNSYIYILNSPVSCVNFLNNKDFMNIYSKNVGRDNADISVMKFSEKYTSVSEYKDVTRQVVHMPEGPSCDNSVAYSAIRPQYSFQAEDTNIQFDYQSFIASTSSLVFPIELRTEANMTLIGKLATVYGLSVDRMRILVKNCVNLENKTFDQEKLKIQAMRQTSDVKAGSDPYSMSPVSFLQSKQNGAPVTFADKKILEYLSLTMHFSNEVINVMIEYILKTSDNRLVKAYVDMVAGEWARDHVTTKEQAIEETKKKVTYSSRTSGSGKNVLPQYLNQQNTASENMSEEQLRIAREALEKMGV